MDRLRIGVALYNSGRYLAAHEPLEESWLGSPAGQRDDCIQGVLQASVAVYKSREGNEPGAAGLAKSAIGYLNACEAIAVDDLLSWLGRLAADPDLGRRERPPELQVGGEAIGLDDLAPEDAIAAVEAVAETEGDELLETAAAYAESDIKGDETSPFVALAVEYINNPRPIVRQRLREHVDRRRTRESDVEGLF
jgi:hypothetical protein